MKYYKHPVIHCPNEIRGIYTDVNDERIGGFLVPFLTGALVSAPLWYLGANNKLANSYYQNQQYPMYYPYYTNTNYPSYYPYPPYR